jgi:hypothetical protein
MDNIEKKKNLVLEMMAFAVVDGQLHKKEFDFIFMVANTLGIERGEFMDLFHQESPIVPMKEPFDRVLQFYRLALLMYADGIVHSKEDIAIRQFGIKMGIDTNLSKRILKRIELSPNRVISADILLRLYNESLS